MNKEQLNKSLDTIYQAIRQLNTTAEVHDQLKAHLVAISDYVANSELVNTKEEVTSKKENEDKPPISNK